MAVKTLKYVAVREALLEQIEDGKYKVSELVPSERELMDTYGVSRITVRKALDSLVQDGYLNRIQGKGTYVRGGMGQDLISLTSFTEDMRSRGRIVSRAVNSVEVIEAGVMVADDLGIAPEDKVLRFDRVFLADAQPVNRTISYLPMELFPGIEEFDLGRESLYELVEGTYGIEIVHARRMLDAVLANEEDAKTLRANVGDPLIRFQGFTYANVTDAEGRQQERIIETFTCRYRSEPNRFDISQVRVPRDRRGTN